ncbi:MAG: PAS domain-containing protein [Desulfobacteraceae bacterium]|nr:MAG: PAS domain-containing protein [Desulfobacteraceae bacterium]
MQILSYKKLYLPAFAIIAIVLLLIFMIALSTYRTLNHQRETALAFLHSQGATLLYALEAAALTGMLTPGWSEDSVETLIFEFGKNKNIAYIYMYDANGIISHSSDILRHGTKTSWRPELESDNQVIARLLTSADDSQVYELAKRYSPWSHAPQGQTFPMSGSSARLPFLDHHAGDTVVLGMSTEEYEAAHHADIQHAVFMGAILLVLGTAALFFTFVIQNYYLTDKAFNQSRDYLRLVMASMSNGILSIDAQGKIISINSSARDLLDLKDKDVKAFDLKSMIDFQSSGIGKTLAESTPVVDKEIIYHKASRQVPLAMTISPIMDEDKKSPYTGAVITLRDLTEIKRLQEKVRRSERLAAVGELAAGVAHEVRNPLSSIRGFAQFLKHVLRERPKEREYAELMVKEVDRIDNVVTNLLSFARPVHPEPAPTDISGMLNHTVRLVQADANLRNVTIGVVVPHGLEKINLDGNQITQVMLNLILNALQAVDMGGDVSVEARGAGSEILALSVEDDGPGIPPDELKRIFDPFYTTREKGTGLGLAIVQMIVENHGGEITVMSPVPGKRKGCRITVHLPIAP